MPPSLPFGGRISHTSGNFFQNTVTSDISVGLTFSDDYTALYIDIMIFSKSFLVCSLSLPVPGLRSLSLDLGGCGLGEEAAFAVRTGASPRLPWALRGSAPRFRVGDFF